MVDTSYEPFSRQPEYIEVNRGFIQSLPLKGKKTILDLACGTGTLADLLLECHSIETILGLDLSHESLLLAREHFMPLGVLETNEDKPQSAGEAKSKLDFVRGSADCLPLDNLSMDAVVMGNSFHNLPDQDLLLREIGRVLKPGCVFAFNTSFFAGTYPPSTEKLYHEWLKIALAHIATKDHEMKKNGLAGIPRKRGTSHKAFSKKWPTAEEFTQLLLRNGFDVKWFCHRTIRMNKRSLETVGAYGGLASVLLSGYPVEIACEALEAAAGPAFESFGSEEVRRLWLEVVAVNNGRR